MARAVRRYVLFIFSFIAFNIICLFFSDNSFAQYRRPSPKPYTLYGHIQLTYEKKWSDDYDLSEFEHDYNLGIKGFIIDPRLIRYEISGDFTQALASGEGEDTTITGKKLNVTFLDTLPKKWERNWMFIPNPITLSYSDYSGKYESTNYGISFRYSKPLVPKPRRPGRVVVEDRPLIPVPTTYFDYDRYEFRSGQYNTVIDIFNLRSTISGKIYNYTLSYKKQNASGIIDTKTDVIEFRPNYRFFDPKGKGLIDISNSIKHETIDERKSITLRSGINWTRRIDKDVLRLFGRYYYYNTTEEDEKTLRRTALASASYTKEFSQRMRNSISFIAESDKDDERDNYLARFSDTFTFDLSRAFRGSASLLIGQNQDGLEYGANFSLSTRTRLNATTAYFFAFTPMSEGDVSSHMFSVVASGPIVSNISFTADARYLIRDVTGIENPYSTDSITSNANLFYRLRKMTVSLGGGYSQNIEKNSETTRYHNFNLHSNLSWLLRRNLFLNVFSSWNRDSDDKTAFNMKPRLSYRRGLFSVEAEYDYRRTSQAGVDATADHRLFMRLIRRFPSLL